MPPWPRSVRDDSHRRMLAVRCAGSEASRARVEATVPEKRSNYRRGDGILASKGLRACGCLVRHGSIGRHGSADVARLKYDGGLRRGRQQRFVVKAEIRSVDTWAGLCRNRIIRITRAEAVCSPE